MTSVAADFCPILVGFLMQDMQPSFVYVMTNSVRNVGGKAQEEFDSLSLMPGNAITGGNVVVVVILVVLVLVVKALIVVVVVAIAVVVVVVVVAVYS